MKNILYILFAVCLFSSCSDDDNGEGNTTEYTSMKINAIEGNIFVGDTYNLTLDHEPKNLITPICDWTSSNPKVATVGSGKSQTVNLKALSPGKTTITAKHRKFTSKIEVTVLEKQSYTSFQIMQNQIEIQSNTVIGYKIGNYYKRLADLGDLKKGKWSKEVNIEDNSIKEIYVFTDYMSTRRLDVIFSIQNNKNNMFEIPANTKGIEVSDKSNPLEYPQ